MKHLLIALLSITFMGFTVSITAQKGFKVAEKKSGKLKAYSAEQLSLELFGQKNQGMVGTSLMHLTGEPRIIRKGKASYISFSVVQEKTGEKAQVAFEIDSASGYTSNFKFVCKGKCKSGGGCGFTYDHAGRIDGCSCCDLDIERIPSNNYLTPGDIGF